MHQKSQYERGDVRWTLRDFVGEPAPVAEVPKLLWLLDTGRDPRMRIVVSVVRRLRVTKR
jgi:hypothetical protein